MSTYEHKRIEEHWQKYWEENRHTYIPQIYVREGVIMPRRDKSGNIVGKQRATRNGELNDGSVWVKVE